jgi:SAM-dependent methyltransferase
MTNKASQDYWDQSFQGVRLAAVDSSDSIRLWIRRHILPKATGSCLEIGCYPGRYLPVFGELGYECNGVDLQKNVGAIGPWLEDMGFRTGQFWQEDFLAFEPLRQFDLVASFGFMEHFTNWKEVFEKHLRFVKDDGYLVIETPNYLGAWQHWLHSRFDKEDLDRHYIPSMDVDQWVSIVKDAGFEVVYQGYFDGFDFWVGLGERNFFSRCCVKFLRGIRKPLGALLPKNRKLYSPYGGIIAKKLPAKSF